MEEATRGTFKASSMFVRISEVMATWPGSGA